MVVLPKSVVIIGAGAAGLFSARRLRQLGVQDITLLEKEPKEGGKCSTYLDPNIPHLQAEKGAVIVAPNYGVVLDAMIEKNIKTTQLPPSNVDTIAFIHQINALSRFGKVKFALKFSLELIKFWRGVWIYNKARKHAKPLPDDLELPFSVYTKKYGLENINQFLKLLVTAFGYGAMEECPTYSILEYIGYATIPSIVSGHYGYPSIGLNSLREGFQHLMTEIAKDFNVEKSVAIQQIVRNNESVSVQYTQPKIGITKHLTADLLILAVPPVHWKELFTNDQLSLVEAECIQHLTHYRYPIAICRIKNTGLTYIPEALERKQFGHVALICTCDKTQDPENGRLCTVYINVPPGDNTFTKENTAARILEDLYKIPGVTEVTILEIKIWEDYFCSLPWKQRLALEQQQFAASTRTMYAGSYTLGSFEDVACIANRAAEVIDSHYQVPSSKLSDFRKACRRFFQYRKLYEPSDPQPDKN